MLDMLGTAWIRCLYVSCRRCSSMPSGLASCVSRCCPGPGLLLCMPAIRAPRGLCTPGTLLRHGLRCSPRSTRYVHRSTKTRNQEDVGGFPQQNVWRNRLCLCTGGSSWMLRRCGCGAHRQVLEEGVNRWLPNAFYVRLSKEDVPLRTKQCRVSSIFRESRKGLP